MPLSIDRRTFLRVSAAAAGWGILGVGRRARAAEILDTRVISHQPSLYHGWPTVARGRSGELFVACSGGRENHVCPFGRVEWIRSSDGGLT